MHSTGKKLIVRVVSGDSDNDDNDGDKEVDGRIHRRGSVLSRRLVTERIQDARRREVCSGTCETESAKTQHPTVTLLSATDRNKLAIGSASLVHARELIIGVRLPCVAIGLGSYILKTIHRAGCGRRLAGRLWLIFRVTALCSSSPFKAKFTLIPPSIESINCDTRVGDAEAWRTLCALMWARGSRKNRDARDFIPRYSMQTICTTWWVYRQCLTLRWGRVHKRNVKIYKAGWFSAKYS